MERLRLSKNEKKALRSIALQYGCLPHGMSEQSFSAAVASLQQQGLVDAVFASGHVVVDAMLTDYGAAYLEANPTLRSPVDWRWVIGTAISAVAAIAAVTALFISCSLLKQ